MDFNPYELYTQTYTQILLLKHGNSKNTNSRGTMTSLQYLRSIISLKNNGELENFGKIQTFWGFEKAENC